MQTILWGHETFRRYFSATFGLVTSLADVMASMYDPIFTTPIVTNHLYLWDETL